MLQIIFLSANCLDRWLNTVVLIEIFFGKYFTGTSVNIKYFFGPFSCPLRVQFYYLFCAEGKKVTEGNELPRNLKPDVVDRMEIDNVDPGKAGIADKGTNTKTSEGNQVLSNASKNSDANRPARKRITPIAIN